ncbi:MAG: hypothetical protein ACJAS4_001652 [Bacteriovoracaceae bacterium]|jgi:hypothetical protein
MLDDQKEKYQLLINKLVNQDFDINDVKSINDVSLDPDYLNILIQNTPTRYMLLGNNDKCSIYDLMNTNLLRSPGGKIEYVVFQYKGQNGTVQKRLLSKEVFLNTIAKKQCPQNQKFGAHFKLKNLRNTLTKIKIITPDSEMSCIDNMANFRKDLKTPYLCNIIEQIRGIKSQKVKFNNLSKTDYKKRSILQREINLGESYKKIISTMAIDNLEGQCLGLNNPRQYCTDYFQQSYWSKVFFEQPNTPVIKNFCGKLSKKKCLRELNKSPYYCHFSGKDFPSLTPKPNCTNTSRALLKSRLFANYNDCPANTGNDAVTSFSRVLNHFEGYLETPVNACEVNSTYPFAKFNEEFTDFAQWQIQLCYIDTLIGNEKVCRPTVFGNVPKDDLSLSKVVGKIASRLKGYSGNECRILNAKEYKPSLLEFQSGCYIIRNEKKCTGTNCNFKVMLGQNTFDKFDIESKLSFELFPVDFINENKSLKNLYSKNKKKNFKTIKNMSSFLTVFKNHKKAIFLGMGCGEELLPSFFNRKYLNQCTVLPFIIDGFIEKNKIYSLITRTSLDQVHSPRIIPWAYISAAIKQYRSLSPINAWGFYAIY